MNESVALQLQAAALDGLALLRVDAVSAMAGLSRSTLFARSAAGTFPQPLRMGTRCTRWRAADVQTWLKAQQSTPATTAEPQESPAAPAPAPTAPEVSTRRRKAPGGAARLAAVASA